MATSSICFSLANPWRLCSAPPHYHNHTSKNRSTFSCALSRENEQAAEEAQVSRKQMLRKVDIALERGDEEEALAIVTSIQGKHGGLRGFGAARQVPQRLYTLEELRLNKIDTTCLLSPVDTTLGAVRRNLQISVIAGGVAAWRFLNLDQLQLLSIVLGLLTIGGIDLVRTIMVTRWNGFNTPLHMLAHALTPRFYDEELIAQSNGKRKAPHKDKEVASGVKKAFQRLFPASLQTKLRNEFASFAAGFEDFRDISAMEERTTMNSIKWWTCHGSAGVHLQDVATRVLSQVASSSAAERNWSTYGFIHNVKRNRLGSQKAEDLVYVHSNLCLVSRRGEEYTSGPHKDWDVDP